MKMKMLTLSAVVLVLLTGAKGCPEEATPAARQTAVPTTAPSRPPGTRTLEIKVWADPIDGGHIVVNLGGVATVPKPKDGGPPRPALQEGDIFPYSGAQPSPYTHELHYEPGVLLSVTVTVIAPPVQEVVGCQIRDRGKTVAYRLVKIGPRDKAGTSICSYVTPA